LILISTYQRESRAASPGATVDGGAIAFEVAPPVVIFS